MDRADELAFEEFVRWRSPALLKTAYLLTGDRGHAEDLLQGALAQVYRHWHRIHANGVPEAYVRRAMVNHRISSWRRRRVPEAPLDPQFHATTQDDVSALDQRDELWRALREVTPAQRAVLVLRYYEGYSEAEIAAALACSPGSVKSHASRGLARLRAALGVPAPSTVSQE